MLIAHVAPFAPHQCGLYEAARDMMKADLLGGNDAIFVDTGKVVNGEHVQPQMGLIDDRNGFKLETVNPDRLDQADIIMMHTGAVDSWFSKNQAPFIWVFHGRPLASFRPNQGSSYILYNNVGNWVRTKKILYFWNEFRPHWELGIVKEKHVVIDPVIDEIQFSNVGNKANLPNKKQYNFLICESNREDVDIYETLIGAVEAAKYFDNIKFFVFGLDMPIETRFGIVLHKLEKLGALGGAYARVDNMDCIYRDMDCTISPNRITTRVIAESLSCGTPVIAQSGNKDSQFDCNLSNPYALVEAVKSFMESDIRRLEVDTFNLRNYYTKMNQVYKEVLSNG